MSAKRIFWINERIEETKRGEGIVALIGQGLLGGLVFMLIAWAPFFIG